MTRRTRSLPFFRQERESLLLDLLCGAAGGALGTWLMGPTMRGVSKVMPQKLQPQGEPRSEQQEEAATEKLARKLLEPFGIPLQDEQKRKKAGNLVHYGYGITCGALYGVLHRRSSLAGKLLGFGFGLGLFLVGDELLVPVLKLGAPPQKTPLAIHLGALAAHLSYGGVTEGSYRLLRRAFA